jgi:hypothetical protein
MISYHSYYMKSGQQSLFACKALSIFIFILPRQPLSCQYSSNLVSSSRRRRRDSEKGVQSRIVSQPRKEASNNQSWLTIGLSQASTGIAKDADERTYAATFLNNECNECKKGTSGDESLLRCGVCKVDPLLDVALKALLTCLKKDFLFFVNMGEHVDSFLGAIRLFHG